ncbi:MAG: citrate/2-methylcitrate synthase [Thermoplasmataceae archaeon]|jgi:citrate synthase
MPETNDKPEFSRGLEGVIAAETKIGYVDGQAGRLVYRGYEISELAGKSNYEEVSYLLVNGHLPNEKEYRDYDRKLKELRTLKPDTYSLIKEIGKSAHPMSTLRTVVSYIGAKDSRTVEPNLDEQHDLGIELIAKMPTIVGAINRVYRGEEIVKPDHDLTYSDFFFHQAMGRKPSDVESKMLDTALILHADHGMNASTFACMLTISTLSDMYSAVTSAISALKGPLHGGANERALALIEKVGSPENADKVIGKMIENKEKIMGFGHRVYKVYDPRAKILKEYAHEVTSMNGKEELFHTANKIEEVMISKLGNKGIFPNVDFYSGMLYSSIGFSREVFTPIFAVGRISGWVARSLEYVRDNRLFRPKALYGGTKELLKYVPINERD